MTARFDSGYTSEEIEAILDELVDDATERELGPEAGLMVALEIGILEGDVLEVSDAGTVLLSWPRSAIDDRIAEIRAALARGTPLLNAIAALPELPADQ